MTQYFLLPSVPFLCFFSQKSYVHMFTKIPHLPFFPQPIPLKMLSLSFQENYFCQINSDFHLVKFNTQFFVSTVFYLLEFDTTQILFSLGSHVIRLSSFLSYFSIFLSYWQLLLSLLWGILFMISKFENAPKLKPHPSSHFYPTLTPMNLFILL